MSEGSFSLEQLAKDSQKAAEVVEKKSDSITNPMARFNLGLDNSNPDWQPTPENGLESASEPVSSEKLLQELGSPEKVADPETGQKFNLLKLNWERLQTKGEKRVLVFFPPYNNAVEEGATHYRIRELARQIGHPTLALDHPQMGGSDRLTEEQKKGLVGEEGYGPIAEAQLRVMKSLGIREADLVGQSMGGWAVTAMAESAEKYGIKIRSAVVIDAPGMVEMKPGELVRNEMKEGKYLDLYQSAPYDPEMRLASGQHYTPLRKNLNLVRWILSSLVNDPGGVYRKAMAKESLSGRLKSSLESNPDLQVKIINGSLSQVSPREANLDMVKSLQSEFPGRVSQAIFPGEPHLVMESAKRFAATVKTTIQK